MIYCVEDDADIRELELYTLSSMGFEAQGFVDGKSFFEKLNAEKPDLFIGRKIVPERLEPLLETLLFRFVLRFHLDSSFRSVDLRAIQTAAHGYHTLF